MFVKIVEESAVNWCLCRVLWPSGKTSTGELHNREERDNFLDQRKLFVGKRTGAEESWYCRSDCRNIGDPSERIMLGIPSYL